MNLHNYDVGLQTIEGNTIETLLDVFKSTTIRKDMNGKYKRYYIFDS